MKNKLTSIALLLFCTTAGAQTGLYLQASLNACNLSSTGYRTFQKAGIYASFGQSEELDWLKGGLIQYGIAFSQKGARKAPDPKNNDFVEYNIRLNYVEVPVNLFFKLKGLKGLFGLSGGYLIGQEEKGLNGTPFTTPTKYKKLDFMASAGFAVPLGNKVLLSLKGSLSILPIVGIGQATSIAFAKASRNQVISIGMTYVFVRKKPAEEEAQ